MARISDGSTLCALRDVCESYQLDQFKKIKAEANRHVRNQGMLLDSNDEQYKLVPTEFDKSAFISLVDQRVDDSSGRIRETYDYFKDEIAGYVSRDTGKMLALLRSILNDFGFVEISLDPHDEPEKFLNHSMQGLNRYFSLICLETIYFLELELKTIEIGYLTSIGNILKALIGNQK